MKKAGSMFWTIVISITLVYASLCLLLYFFQSHIIYQPDKELIGSPRDIQLDYEDISFQSSDGIHLHGWFIPAKEPRGVLFFCHGNAGNMSHRLETLRLYNRLGLSVFIFDYRGYGTSAGKTDEKGTYLDAEAAWNYLVTKRKVSQDKIIVLGRSLGGGIALSLADKIHPKAFIIESSFTSIPAVASQHYFFLPMNWIIRIKYDNLAKIPLVKSPILIIHSKEDKLIPFDHGLKLYETANDPKEFLEITGTHGNGFLTSGKVYEQKVKAFIDTYLAD